MEMQNHDGGFRVFNPNANLDMDVLEWVALQLSNCPQCSMGSPQPHSLMRVPPQIKLAVTHFFAIV